MKNKVKYEELQPRELWERMKEFPVAYLPMGTLEWHGLHMPLGADGIQARGVFEIMAERYGGVVLPMLFLGPDYKKCITDESTHYGLDIHGFEDGKHMQLPGSCYYIDDELFDALLNTILRNLKRCGFQIVVAHGHGPSVDAFASCQSEFMRKYGLKTYTMWDIGYQGDDGLQTDHAAANETSITMAVVPELVSMENLDKDAVPVGVWGKDPRVFASEEEGQRIIEMNVSVVGSKLREMVKELSVEPAWPEFHNVKCLLDLPGISNFY